MPDSIAIAPGWVFALPSLGADMDIGTIIEWRVAPGDTVAKGDVVARVETEKADIDVEIWKPGVVTELLAPAGSELPVGTPIIRLDGNEDLPESGLATAGVGAIDADANESAKIPSVKVGPRPRADDSTRTLSSPRARQLADQHGIDLSTVDGSGPDRAIIVRDLDDVAATLRPPEASERPAKGPRSDLSAQKRMRKVIADRMDRANREIPHYHLVRDVDIGATLDWLADHNEARPIDERVLPAALFIRSVGLAAAKVPALNGFWTEEGFRQAVQVDVGVAVSLRRGGLLTPVIPNANTLTVDETMAALTEVVSGARSGTMKSRWMGEASITVTNLGANGADRVAGVIFPPQVALVGFGRTRQQATVVDGLVVARPTVSITLSADHRATDGATGSRFLAKLAHCLQNPEK